ncbi:nose resistant to fluoxetine protein 6-like [Anneissia japonica]|uniref:nose resistant to fluoxetine protein 6-like n=1 Tax=Anneissia japonica TaxID=1529436 RepID=UPI00142595DD|nr:nose resistant to fluoxetine protein 6-like [Anneissia japonica]
MTRKLTIFIILTCLVLLPTFVSSIEEAINFLDVRGELKRLNNLYAFNNYNITTELSLLDVLKFIFRPEYKEAIRNAEDVSEECRENMIAYIEGKEAGADFANRMYYSNGDIPDRKALWSLDFHSYGNYELCVGVPEKSPDATFATKQCGLVILPFEFRIAYCFPVSCTNNDLKEITKAVLVEHWLPWPKPGKEFNNFEYQCIDEVPWSAGSIVTMCIISILAALVIAGTIFEIVKDYTTKQEGVLVKYQSNENYGFTQADEILKSGAKIPAIEAISHEVPFEVTTSSSLPINEKANVKNESFSKVEIDGVRPPPNVDKNIVLGQTLLSFSALTNGRKILKVNSKSGQLDCLNGIRVLSMWWVILGHATSFLFLRIDNFPYLFDVYKKFTFLAISNATFSVDSFFVLSGLLITYLTLKHLKKFNGRINWAMFYFHRFWRLTPFYMVVLSIHANLIVYFGKGQGLIEWAQREHNTCANYWWTNLLYINNLYPFPGSLTTQCMSWAWYLANDMQFFVISPFIIILLHKRWRVGISAIGTLCLLSFAATAYIATYWGMIVQGGAYNQQSYNNRTQELEPGNDDLIYGKPYCRIPAYLVGMVVGFILFKIDKKKVKFPLLYVLLGWGVAIATGLAVIYGLWGTYEPKQMDQGVAVFYTTVSRFAWSVAVGWVAFACVTGYGGFANTLLSWGVWGPLGRLSYGAYLVHPFLIYNLILSMKTGFHFTYANLSVFYISVLALSYACAFVLSLLVEGPFMALEKVIFGKQKNE